MRSVSRLLFVAAVLFPPACRGSRTDGSSLDVGNVGAPLDEPAGLVAEFRMAPPSTWWNQGRVWAALGPQPTGNPDTLSWSQALHGYLGGPAALADELDASAAVFGAAVLDKGEFGVVLALPLHRAARLLDGLTRGMEAPYTVQVDPRSHVSELRARAEAAALPALGIAGAYLLVADRPRTLHAVAPYVVRTLAVRGAPWEHLEVTARGSAATFAVQTALRCFWDRTKAAWTQRDERERPRHGVSAPMFGDPAVALDQLDASVGELTALLGDVATMHATVHVEEDRAHLRVAVTARSPAGPLGTLVATPSSGDAAPLLDLPADVTVAAWSQATRGARQRQAAAGEASFAQLFSGKIPKSELPNLHTAVTRWTEGRGDWLVAGAAMRTVDPATPWAIYVRGAVADAARFDDGLRRTLALPTLPGFAAALAPWVGPLVAKSPLASNPLGASHVTLTGHRAFSITTQKSNGGLLTSHLGSGDTLDVSWAVDHDRFQLAVAPAAMAALKHLAGVSLQSRLQDYSEVRRALASIGNEKNNLAFAFLYFPFKPWSKLIVPADPLLIAWGSRENEGHQGPAAVMHVDASVRTFAQSK